MMANKLQTECTCDSKFPSLEIINSERAPLTLSLLSHSDSHSAAAAAAAGASPLGPCCKITCVRSLSAFVHMSARVSRDAALFGLT